MRDSDKSGSDVRCSDGKGFNQTGSDARGSDAL